MKRYLSATLSVAAWLWGCQASAQTQGPTPAVEQASPEKAEAEEAGLESAPKGARRDGDKLTLERLEFKLGMRLMFLDVDGPGGFSNRDVDSIRPESRSPYVTLERATLDARAHATPWLQGRVRLRATSGRTRADRAYLQTSLLKEQLRFQLGLNKPLMRVDRRSQSHSPVDTAFWRNLQYHFAADVTWKNGVVEPRFVPSVAFARPLGDDTPEEDGAFGMVSFADDDSGESNPIEVGAFAGASGYGVTLGGFGFVGKLSDNEDVLYLQRIFPNYDLAGDPNSRVSRWYGPRIGFERWGLWIHGEYVWAKQGLLERSGYDLAMSYTFGFPLGGYDAEIEPMIRRGELNITNFPEQFDIPQTWDRSQWLFAVFVRPIPSLELKLERLLHSERTGQSRAGKSGVEDDEWMVLLQLEVGNGP